MAVFASPFLNARRHAEPWQSTTCAGTLLSPMTCERHAHGSTHVLLAGRTGLVPASYVTITGPGQAIRPSPTEEECAVRELGGHGKEGRDGETLGEAQEESAARSSEDEDGDGIGTIDAAEVGVK